MKQQSIECHIAIGQLLKAAWCKCLHTSTSVCKILRHYCVTLDFIIVQKSKNWYDVMRRNCKFLFTALGPLTFELCSAYLRGIKTDRKQFRAISNWFRQICKYKNKKMIVWTEKLLSCEGTQLNRNAHWWNTTKHSKINTHGSRKVKRLRLFLMLNSIHGTAPDMKNFGRCGVRWGSTFMQAGHVMNVGIGHDTLRVNRCRHDLNFIVLSRLCIAIYTSKWWTVMCKMQL